MNYVSRLRCLLCLLLGAFITPLCFAKQPADPSLDMTLTEKPGVPFRYSLQDNHFRVKGFKLAQNLYFGQTKINRMRDWGLVIDRDTIVYALNKDSVSVSVRF